MGGSVCPREGRREWSSNVARFGMEPGLQCSEQGGQAGRGRDGDLSLLEQPEAGNLCQPEVAVHDPMSNRFN